MPLTASTTLTVIVSATQWMPNALCVIVKAAEFAHGCVSSRSAWTSACVSESAMTRTSSM